MSQENVEVVRAICAEWEKGNFFSTPELFAASFRATWIDPLLVQRGETLGLLETGRRIREWLEAYEAVSVKTEEFFDAGEQVVTIATWRGRGRSSGVEFGERMGTVWTLSNGKVTRLVHHREPDKALEAAGLSE